MGKKSGTKVITVTSTKPQNLEDEIAKTASALGGIRKERIKKTVATAKKPTTKSQTKKAAKTTAVATQRKTIPAKKPPKTYTRKSPEDTYTITVRHVKKNGTTSIPSHSKQASSISPTLDTEKKPATTHIPIRIEDTPPPKTSNSLRVAAKKENSIKQLEQKITQPPTHVTIRENRPITKEVIMDDITAEEIVAISDQLLVLSSKLAEKATSRELVKDKNEQKIKIYDTAKYHLPIKPNRHNRNVRLPLRLQILILIILLVGAVIYAQQTDLLNQIQNLLQP